MPRTSRQTMAPHVWNSNRDVGFLRAFLTTHPCCGSSSSLFALAGQLGFAEGCSSLSHGNNLVSNTSCPSWSLFLCPFISLCSSFSLGDRFSLQRLEWLELAAWPGELEFAAILLLLPPECWNYRRALLCLVGCSGIIFSYTAKKCNSDWFNQKMNGQ